jgi:hypothetical protein
MTAPRFRLTAPVQPEQELHETVAEMCGRMIAPPAEWAFYPAGAIPLTGQEVAKLARMGRERPVDPHASRSDATRCAPSTGTPSTRYETKRRGGLIDWPS